MNLGHSYHLDLSADVFGFANFRPIGRLYQPSLAFAQLIETLRNDEATVDEFLVHALASKIAGRLVFHTIEVENVIRAWNLSRLAAEWRIAIPTLGLIQALFLVARLQMVRETERLFDVALELAGKPLFEVWRPCGP